MTADQLEQADQALQNIQKDKSTQQFGGLEFGVGISFTADVGKTDRIREAEVVDGIVRVTDEENGRARIMLESHFFFTPQRFRLFGLENRATVDDEGKKTWTSREWGLGPFVALQPGTDDIIDAIGMGMMIGMRHDSTSTQSFNIGLGWVVDPNTRVLGDGIVANEPLPGNETAIRYKEEMQNGVLILGSFAF